MYPDDGGRAFLNHLTGMSPYNRIQNWIWTRSAYKKSWNIIPWEQ